jgi:hypothetical protein
MHGLFVDDMMHSSMSDAFRDQITSENQVDFDTTLDDVLSSLLGMEIEGSHGPFGYIHPGDTGRVQGVCHKIPQAKASADATWNYAGTGGLTREP